MPLALPPPASPTLPATASPPGSSRPWSGCSSPSSSSDLWSSSQSCLTFSIGSMECHPDFTSASFLGCLICFFLHFAHGGFQMTLHVGTPGCSSSSSKCTSTQFGTNVPIGLTLTSMWYTHTDHRRSLSKSLNACHGVANCTVASNRWMLTPMLGCIGPVGPRKPHVVDDWQPLDKAVRGDIDVLIVVSRLALREDVHTDVAVGQALCSDAPDWARQLHSSIEVIHELLDL
eukprot:6808306-Pyramimonas_sp.AAC.1